MLIKISKRILPAMLAIALIGITVFCRNTEKPKPVPVAKPAIVKIQVTDSIKIDRNLNDIAYFIAGMKVSDSSKIRKLCLDPEWLNFSKNIDTNWAKLDIKRISRIKEWSGKEMADINKDGKVIFYPFSGADFIHVYNFFPQADKYIMIGLERCGTVPKFFPNTKSAYIKEYFHAVRRSIEDLLRMSFFRTSDMSYDMNNQYINGTLPVMMMFMARSGNDIISIKPVTLNKIGEIIYTDSMKVYKGKDNYSRGYEIKFKDFETKRPKNVYYFCADISDNGLKANAPFSKFLNSLDTNVTTYIKSASYLMHLKEFNFMRNHILAHSRYLLQDDSGVPMRYIKTDTWDLKYYGIYDKPINSFKQFFQPELKTAFEKADKISFKVGYGYVSHQILARKKLKDQDHQPEKK